MRSIFTIVLAALFPMVLNAQEITVSESSEKMGKEEMWCFSARYNHEEEITREVLGQRVMEAGIKKGTEKKGVSIYKGATWTDISAAKCDYYLKTKSKKNKATVYLCVSKGYNNFVTSANDAATAANITAFLQKLEGQIAAAEAIKLKEAELQAIDEKNKEAQRELEKAKGEQAEKAGQLEDMKRGQK
jgi:hypothetical protein